MKDLTQQGITALKRGDKKRARQLLRAAVKQNPNDVKAWLWLSGAVDTNRERAICLQRVLQLDPDNATATRGLTQLVAQGGVRLETDEKDQPESTKDSRILAESKPMVDNPPAPSSKKRGFVTQPSLLPLLLRVIASVFLFWVLFTVSGSIPDDVRPIVKFFLILGILSTGLRLFVDLLRRLFTRYTLTTEHLIVREGVLSRSRKTIPIHRIQDVEYKQTVAKRLIGVSNLKVESAGEKGEVLLKDLSRGRRYDDTILSAIHEQEARLG